MKRITLLMAAALSPAVWAADYTIRALPESGKAHVTVSLGDETASEFRMPAWAPGDYEIFNYGKLVENAKFFRDGQQVTATYSTTDPNLWTISGGADKVEYEVGPSRGNFSVNLRVTANEMFVSGPGVFGWFKGHDREEQKLTILFITPQDKVVCPLPTQGTDGRYQTFTAPDYDTMLDSPFVVGKDVKTVHFKAGGKDHTVAFYNRPIEVDAEAWKSVCIPIVEECQKLFGMLPYEHYVFFCDVGGGGGGLEHLSSTRLGIYSPQPQSAAGLISHEYFHLYNVKRIRPYVLGPFDYTNPAITTSLWWLEGVTDYYADVIRFRAGQMTQTQFIQTMRRTTDSLARSEAAKRVSAEESSRRVWESEGSQGFGGLSYYTKGKGIGVCLDLAIRFESSNTYSLDNVMVDLFKETHDKPGYQESRIRELCVKYGGEKLGPLYDLCVKTTNPLPAEELFAKCGILSTGGAGITVQPSTVGSMWPRAVPN